MRGSKYNRIKGSREEKFIRIELNRHSLEEKRGLSEQNRMELRFKRKEVKRQDVHQNKGSREEKRGQNRIKSMFRREEKQCFVIAQNRRFSEQNRIEIHQKKRKEARSKHIEHIEQNIEQSKGS